jgi:hypothetical protein
MSAKNFFIPVDRTVGQYNHLTITYNRDVVSVSFYIMVDVLKAARNNYLNFYLLRNKTTQIKSRLCLDREATRQVASVLRYFPSILNVTSSWEWVRLL